MAFFMIQGKILSFYIYHPQTFENNFLSIFRFITKHYKMKTFSVKKFTYKIWIKFSYKIGYLFIGGEF